LWFDGSLKSMKREADAWISNLRRVHVTMHFTQPPLRD
jgi:hypothetical protein